MIFLFLASVFMSVLCFSFIIYCLGQNLTMKFLSLGGVYWGLSLDFDVVTILILLMLSMCFIYVLNYTGHYFSGDVAGMKLNKIICLFVGVMASLVVTGDFLSTLVFWEYLGVVSFFLILFYSSYLSLRSSIVTLVSSRFGDVCLFILMCVSYYYMMDFMWVLPIFFFMMFSKSASLPFISWLLEAMRAPTPVSSLVHSSTLVAAGVWFSMRYDFLLYFNNSFMFMMLLLLTVFITGTCCFFFMDLKKIVALSTCKKMSWCVLYLIFGDFLLSLFQLVSHGVSKCMLFMLVGDVMSGTSGSQASNCVYSSRFYGNWGLFGLFSVILGLSGVPFIGVFFTKHFLLTNFMGVWKFGMLMMVLLCMFLSYMYSFRLCSIMMNTSSSSVIGVLYWFKSGAMPFFWLFMNYFISLSLDELVGLNNIISVNLLLFQVLSCMSAYLLYKSIMLRKWSSSLFGCDKLVEWAYGTFLSLANMASLFFYRWDSHVMALFVGVGGKNTKVYTMNFLKLTVVSIILFLSCYCMMY